jgi:hypothetical protein
MRPIRLDLSEAALKATEAATSVENQQLAQRYEFYTQRRANSLVSRLKKRILNTNWCKIPKRDSYLIEIPLWPTDPAALEDLVDRVQRKLPLVEVTIKEERSREVLRQTMVFNTSRKHVANIIQARIWTLMGCMRGDRYRGWTPTSFQKEEIRDNERILKHLIDWPYRVKL